MPDSDPKHRHDLKRATRTLGTVIELARRGFDFQSEEGKAVLDEAEELRRWLEKELGLDD